MLGVLTDVDKAAHPGKAGAKCRNIDIAPLVDLGRAQSGKIKTSAIVEIKLGGLINNRLGMKRGAKRKPPPRAGLQLAPTPG